MEETCEAPQQTRAVPLGHPRQEGEEEGGGVEGQGQLHSPHHLQEVRWEEVEEEVTIYLTLRSL